MKNLAAMEAQNRKSALPPHILLSQSTQIKQERNSYSIQKLNKVCSVQETESDRSRPHTRGGGIQRKR